MKQLTLTNGKVINVAEDYMVVKNNMLFNENTKLYEGVDGDVVKVKTDGEICKHRVSGYTKFTVIPTRKIGTIEISEEDAMTKSGKKIIHKVYITAEEEVEA